MKSRLITAVLAIGTALGVTAVGLGPAALAQTSRMRARTSPVAVTMFGTQRPDVINLDTNWFTHFVEQRFNLRIHWVLDTGSGTKQALVLASGDYPDIFWGGFFSPSDQLKYAKQGVLISLNKYIHQYAPNVEKAMQDTPGMKRAMVAPDGNIYGIPAINFCDHCSWGSKYWINTTWLKALHLKMPTTTAEFARVLEAFKAHPPVKGAIPLAGDGSDITTFLMNAFIYDDGAVSGGSTADHFLIQNGKLAFAAIQPQWKQGLAYMHLLYQKGLITSANFTASSDVQVSLLRQGRVGVFASLCERCNDPKTWADYVVVPPLRGPDGVHYAAFYGMGPSSVVFTITNKATPDQIRAVMKLVNFVYTLEGTTMLTYGPQGKVWWWAKKGQKGLNGQQALVQINDGAYPSRQNFGWSQMGPINQSAAWRHGIVAAPVSSAGGLENWLYLETKRNYAGHQPRYVYPAAVWVPPAQAEQYGLMQTNINSFVSQWTAQFITGSKDLNTDWAAYVQGVQNLGLSRYLQTAQRAMGTPFDTSSFTASNM